MIGEGLGGAVANYSDAIARNVALRRADTDRLVGGAQAAVKGIGASVQTIQDNKAKEHLKSIASELGLAPELLDAMSPEEAVHAVSKAAFESKQRDFQASQQQAQFEHADSSEETRFGHAKELDEATTSNDIARTLAEREDAERRRREEDEALGKEVGGLIAPATDDVGGFEGISLPIERPATDEDVNARFSEKPGRASALGAARTAVKPPFRPTPTRDEAQIDRDRAEAERARAEAEKLKRPPTPPARNIDPNSPEGIEARLKFEKEKAGLKPAGSWSGRESATGAGLRERANRKDAQIQALEQFGEETLDEADKARLAKLREESAALWAEHDKLTGRGAGGAGAPTKDAAPPVDEATRKAAIEEAKRRGLIPK